MLAKVGLLLREPFKCRGLILEQMNEVGQSLGGVHQRPVQRPQVGADAVGDIVGQFAAELAFEASQRDVLGDVAARRRTGAVPELLEEAVLRPEGVGVDVAVLDHQAGDPVGFCHREAEPELRAVIV
jgi:hypothetical protein